MLHLGLPINAGRTTWSAVMNEHVPHPHAVKFTGMLERSLTPRSCFIISILSRHITSLKFPHLFSQIKGKDWSYVILVNCIILLSCRVKCEVHYACTRSWLLILGQGGRRPTVTNDKSTTVYSIHKPAHRTSRIWFLFFTRRSLVLSTTQILICRACKRKQVNFYDLHFSDIREEKTFPGKRTSVIMMSATELIFVLYIVPHVPHASSHMVSFILPCCEVRKAVDSHVPAALFFDKGSSRQNIRYVLGRTVGICGTTIQVTRDILPEGSAGTWTWR